MAFDALTILRGLNNATPPVYVDLEAADTQATTILPNADGNCIIDLRKTGKKGLAAVMVLPTEPITYASTLTALIEESDSLDRNWQTLVDFSVITALMRRIKLVATTAFIATDIGKTITKSTSLDAGVILQIDQALLAASPNFGTGYILLAMVDAADLFTLDANTGLTTDGTGAGTLLASGEAVSSKGVYIRRFVTSKRYIRSKCTASAGNFYKTQLLVGDDQFDRL